MSDYVKISATFKEKALFFFTGLVKKEHIISKIVEVEVYRYKENVPQVERNTDKPEEIPFFDFVDGDTKSNL
jgi:hypothetical protein